MQDHMTTNKMGKDKTKDGETAANSKTQDGCWDTQGDHS